jgi:hypothetical protein
VRYWLVTAIAALAASPAPAKWREASTDHFIIYSEQSEEQLKAFAGKLERYDRGLRFLYRLPDLKPGPANRVTIFVVPNLAAVRKLARAGKAPGDRNIAGFYIPRAAGSVAFIPRSTGPGDRYSLDEESVLLHEYAHHFMMQNFAGAYPAWLLEGFAEFAATVIWSRDGSANFGAPATHRAYGLLTGNPLPMEKLLDTSNLRLTEVQREAVYGRGWLLTHFLIFEPSRKGQLSDYLKRLNRGEESLAAGKAAFGDLKTLERELNIYLKRRRLLSFRLSPEELPTGQIRMRDLSPAEEAMMDVRIVSRRGVTRDEARALIPAARHAAKPHPASDTAQAVLAEAEFDAGNLAEAEAAADRAIAANPKSVDALVYKGRARMAAAVAAQKFDAAAAREVRKLFVAANRLDPDDPEPLILFYQSFAFEGREPSANATIGLVRALELAPQDRDLRLMVAYKQLFDGKAAEARATLGPIAFDPHGGAARRMAATVIETIDAAGAKAALDKWQGLQQQPDQPEES